MAITSPSNPAAVLQQMLGGATAASLLYVAAELKLPDLLAKQPASSHYLAECTDTDADVLERVLRAMCVIGILSTNGQQFALTPLGEYLRSDVPGSQWSAARLMGHPIVTRAWGGLLQTVQHGGTAFEHALGTDFGSYFVATPEFSAVFNAFMGGITARVAPAVVSAYDLGDVRSLVDVGGGNGNLLRAILRTYPAANGFSYDLPHVEVQAEQGIAADNLAGRCRFVAGDFFKEVPAGADAYLLKSVLHDWDEAACVAILRSCRAAMHPTSRVIIVERTLSLDPDVVMSDLTMLAMVPGGRERTEAEYRALVDQAGLHLERTVPTNGGVNVFEARR
jgi:hypothetical protein